VFKCAVAIVDTHMLTVAKFASACNVPPAPRPARRQVVGIAHRTRRIDFCPLIVIVRVLLWSFRRPV